MFTVLHKNLLFLVGDPSTDLFYIEVQFRQIGSQNKLTTDVISIKTYEYIWDN